MPIYVYAIVNAVLALAIVGAVVGLQLWSILTQHRQPGCEEVRLRLPRLRIRALPAALDRLEAEVSAQEIVLD